jgi:hypothetical protein
MAAPETAGRTGDRSLALCLQFWAATVSGELRGDETRVSVVSAEPFGRGPLPFEITETLLRSR